jgi:hypothetical protein
VVADLLSRPRRGWAVAAALAATSLLVVLVRTEPSLPPSPHAFMDGPDQCTTCHAVYRGQVDPHEFAVPMPEKCLACHPPDRLGRSHPIGIDPRRSAMEVSTPDDLPLEDGKVSCGTCHQPHVARLSLDACYVDQDPDFMLEVSPDRQIPYYRTYFLRKPTGTGFDALCRSCHRDF